MLFVRPVRDRPAPAHPLSIVDEFGPFSCDIVSAHYITFALLPSTCCSRAPCTLGHWYSLSSLDDNPSWPGPLTTRTLLSICAQGFSLDLFLVRLSTRHRLPTRTVRRLESPQAAMGFLPSLLVAFLAISPLSSAHTTKTRHERRATSTCPTSGVVGAYWPAWSTASQSPAQIPWSSLNLAFYFSVDTTSTGLSVPASQTTSDIKLFVKDAHAGAFRLGGVRECNGR